MPKALFIYYRLSPTFLLTLIKVCSIISMALRFLNRHKNTNTQKRPGCFKNEVKRLEFLYTTQFASLSIIISKHHRLLIRRKKLFASTNLTDPKPFFWCSSTILEQKKYFRYEKDMFPSLIYLFEVYIYMLSFST